MHCYSDTCDHGWVVCVVNNVSNHWRNLDVLYAFLQVRTCNSSYSIISAGVWTHRLLGITNFTFKDSAALSWLRKHFASTCSPLFQLQPPALQRMLHHRHARPSPLLRLRCREHSGLDEIISDSWLLQGGEEAPTVRGPHRKASLDPLAPHL